MGQVRTASLMVAVQCAMLGTTACSAEGRGGNASPEDAKAVAVLFSSGFKSIEEDKARIDKMRLAYRPYSGIRRTAEQRLADNLQNFSLTLAMEDPGEFLRSGAAGETADRKLAALGLPPDTLAGATVLMFGLAWELANQRPLTAIDQQALLSQVDNQLKTNELRDRGDTAKQREAEIRLLTAGVWLEEARLRQGSPAQMQALSDAVQRDMLRMSGSDMRAHQIGADGFEKR